MGCNMMQSIEVHRRFEGSYCLHLLLDACFMLVSCVAYSSTLKMATICSSEQAFTGLHGIIFQKTELHYSRFVTG
jgi:hypothetical protein